MTARRCDVFYQTQYTDPTTGDVLAQSRWYSPGTGTFRSRDTYSGDLNTPVSLNRYTYGANNPIRYWDPTGRCIDFSKAACREANDFDGVGNSGVSTNDLKDPTRFGVSVPPRLIAAPTISFGDDLDEIALDVAPADSEADRAIRMYATGIAPGQEWYIAAFDSPLEVYALTQDPCDNYRLASACMLGGAAADGMTDYSMENCRNHGGLDEITACGVSLVNVGSAVKSVGSGVGWLANKFAGGTTLADDILFQVDEFAPPSQRGLSNLGGVIEEVGTNPAGGRLFTSTGPINQNDFAGIVNSGVMRGDVHIFTGAHGFVDGRFVADATLLADDVARFGNIPGVHIYDLPSMSPSQVQTVLDGPGTIIGGICNSGACLARYGG